MSAVWYSFPIFSHFGETDSEGNYWQPDANLAVPYNYPVTAGLPGTVTSVQDTDWGSTVITIALDNPPNQLATHTFFEHLGSASVAPGQHVNANTQIGVTASSGPNLGFGLYSGDIYGSGSAWDTLQADLAPGGPGLLNPTNLIKALASGQVPASGSGSGSAGSLNIDWGSAGQKIGLFVLGLTLAGLGLYILFQSQIDGKIKQAAGVAKKAAVLA